LALAKQRQLNQQNKFFLKTQKKVQRHHCSSTFFNTNTMETNKIKKISQALLLLAAVMLIGSLFVPIWRIELEAPQYPEGLALLIYANKLGGDVDIINGLNHYIGMATLHTENFIEFTLLTYIISAFALFAVIAAFMGKKVWINVLFVSFLVFGIISMVDFYRWNYNYGHNLNPDAAIKVPGMSYQPPLLGYKQLLNFGAFSVPDIGGWLFIGAGVFMLAIIVLENNLLAFFKSKKAAAFIIPLILFLGACGNVKPKAIKVNYDNCEFCKMTIVDEKFACQIVNSKGKAYLFDDVKCLKNYLVNHQNLQTENIYVANYAMPNTFIDINKATVITSNNILSPMGGNLAAFENEQSAQSYIQKFEASIVKWN
jgi:copper chaperone NosL